MLLFLLLVAFQLGGVRPPGYAYGTEQVDATQTYHKRGSPLDDVGDFSEKNSLFNAIWITFYTFLDLFEKPKLQKIRKSFKRFKLPSPSPLLAGQVQNQFKQLYFGLIIFLSDLAKEG